MHSHGETPGIGPQIIEDSVQVAVATENLVVESGREYAGAVGGIADCGDRIAVVYALAYSLVYKNFELGDCIGERYDAWLLDANDDMQMIRHKGPLVNTEWGKGFGCVVEGVADDGADRICNSSDGSGMTGLNADIPFQITEFGDAGPLHQSDMIITDAGIIMIRAAMLAGIAHVR